MLSQTRIPQAKNSKLTRDYLLATADDRSWQTIRGEGMCPTSIAQLLDTLYPSLYPNQRKIFVLVAGLEDWLRSRDWMLDGYQIIPLSDGYHGVKYLYRGGVWYLLEARAWFGERLEATASELLRLCEQLIVAYDQQFSASPWEFFTLGAMASHLFRLRYPQALDWWSHYTAQTQARHKAGRYAAYRAMRLGGVVRSREVRYRGKFALYDAVSAYPSAAVAIGKFPLPGSLVASKTGRGVGFYHIEVDWRDTYQRYQWPRILPTFEDAAMTPLEHGQTYLTSEELRLAQRLGAKIKILEGRVINPKKTTSAPSKFIGELMLARSEWQARGEVHLARHYKFLANALIGKLGQSNANIANDGRRRMARYGTLHVPEWAALITGYARAAILGFANSWNWWHISTDSVLIGSHKYSPNWPEAYTHGGLTFAKQTEGDIIIVLDSNRYLLYRDGVCVKSALSGIPREYHQQIAEQALSRGRRFEATHRRYANLHDILSGTAKTLLETRQTKYSLVLD